MEAHLHKIKLLLALTESPEANEAAAAQAMVDKLVAKYNVTPEQLNALKNKQELNMDDQLLFKVKERLEWKAHLAFIIASKFDCSVMECCMNADSSFHYFLFGPDESVASVKELYSEFELKIDKLVSSLDPKNNVLYDSDYIESYGEGIVAGLSSILEYYKFKVPSKKQLNSNPEDDKPGLVRTTNIINPKEKPTEQKKQVNNKGNIKNIQAYYRGVKDSDLLYDDNLLEESYEGIFGDEFFGD